MDLKKKFKFFSNKQESTLRHDNDRIISNFSGEFLNQDKNIDTAFDNLIKEAYTQHHYKSTENPNEENEVINSIEKVLFQTPEEFDACVYYLKKQQENNFNIDDIYAERSKLRFQLQILSKKISSSILEKSHLYISELSKVQNLQNDLKLAIKATQSSRSNLQSTLSSLSLACLLLLKNNQRNINSLKVLKQLRIIKELCQTDSFLRLNIEQKDFYAAIKLCLESRKELIKYNYYKCLSDSNSKIQDTLDMTEEQMDVSLAKTTSYSPMGDHQAGDMEGSSAIWDTGGLYEQLFRAQALLGKTHTALDQLHMHYTTTIHNRASDIVRIYANKETQPGLKVGKNPFDHEADDPEERLKGGNGSNYKKLQYPELCAIINNASTLPCLTQLLASFYDILLCYYRTIKWYQRHYDQVDESSHFVVDQMAHTHNALEEDFIRNYIFQKLKHGIIRIWQDMQQKINVFLTSIPDLAHLPYDEFINFLQAIIEFMKIGKDFSEGRTSNVLEETLRQECLSYLHSYHCSRIEELKMFLENESWKTCPVRKNFKLWDLQEFKFIKEPSSKVLLSSTWDGDGYVAPTFSEDAADPTVKEKLDLGNVCDKFEKYLLRSNPFRNYGSPKDSSSEYKNVTRSQFEEATSEFMDGQARDNNEEEDHALSLLHRYTDETPGSEGGHVTQTKRLDPALLKRTDSTSTRSMYGAKTQYINRQYLAPILTNSVLTIFRLTGKYLRISSVYPPVSKEVMSYVTQLYDIYLYTVYQIVVGKLHYQMVGHLLSNGLCSTITRIQEELFEDDFAHEFPRNFGVSYYDDMAQRYKQAIVQPPPTSSSANSTRSSALPTESDHLSSDSNNVDPLSQTGDQAHRGRDPEANMAPVSAPPESRDRSHVIVEDYCVAVESLIYLGRVLGTIGSGDSHVVSDNVASRCSDPLAKGIRPIAKDPISDYDWLMANAKIDPVASEILRVACYVISLYVIDYTDVVNMIAHESDWDVKELMSNHSSYINYVIKSYRTFNAKLRYINDTKYKVPKEFYDTLWQNLVSVTFRTIVDGYSNIRKCTNEGRALMQLDLQHLLLNIEDLIAIKDIPDKEFIENYIKAYYMPESEIEDWITKHQEYSTKHLSSLINSMNHLTKRAKTRLLVVIEDPDRRVNQHPAPNAIT